MPNRPVTVLTACALLVLVSGCAGTSEIKRLETAVNGAQKTANEAKAEAAEAKAAAAAAQKTADEAKAAAAEAKAAAAAADEKAERMYKKSVSK